MGVKQNLLDMRLNVFGLELFVESYNRVVLLLKKDPTFPKDKLPLSFTFPCRRSDEAGGDCEITIKQVESKATEELNPTDPARHDHGK